MLLRISTDNNELDVGMVHEYLSQESYWATGISRGVVEKSLAHSLCFGGFLDSEQVAFARVVTDYSTSAHLKDVFVLPSHQRRGYGKAMVQAVMSQQGERTMKRSRFNNK